MKSWLNLQVPIIHRVIQGGAVLCHSFGKARIADHQEDLPVISHYPLGNKGRFRGAFAFYSDQVHVFQSFSFAKLLDGLQREASADAAAGADRGDKAQPVQAVVDAHAHSTFNLQDLRHELRQQGEGQEPVRDGGLEWRLALRAFHVHVNPLVIARGVSELLDAVLGDHEPVSYADFLVEVVLEFIESFES